MMFIVQKVPVSTQKEKANTKVKREVLVVFANFSPLHVIYFVFGT